MDGDKGPIARAKEQMDQRIAKAEHERGIQYAIQKEAIHAQNKAASGLHIAILLSTVMMCCTALLITLILMLWG